MMPLAAGTRYTIDARFEITDQAGNPLAFGIQSSFSTQ
jgi:hypothetical protein